MRRLLAAAIAIEVLVAVRAAVSAVQDRRQAEALHQVLTRPGTALGPYQVVHVIDGDTINVRIGDKTVTVRLIGIDTPETKKPDTPVQCYGPEAAAHTTSLVDQRQVWLEDDPSQGLLDKYGRRLSYVWTDQVLVNEILVRDGYAREYTYDKPYAYQAKFQADQKAAIAAGAGLWAPAGCHGTR